MVPSSLRTVKVPKIPEIGRILEVTYFRTFCNLRRICDPECSKSFSAHLGSKRLKRCLKDGRRGARDSNPWTVLQHGRAFWRREHSATLPAPPFSILTRQQGKLGWRVLACLLDLPDRTPGGFGG